MSSSASITPPGKYTRTAIVLHWLIAAAIIVNVLLIWTVDSVPDAWARPMINTHKSIGLTVLGLGLMRLLWRATHRPPPYPAAYARWETLGARWAHSLLYAVILVLPLTGWLHDSAWKGAPEHPLRWFDLVPVPRFAPVMSMAPESKKAAHDFFGAAHAWAAYLLYVLFVLHVGGALKHQVLDRERELQRMWP